MKNIYIVLLTAFLHAQLTAMESGPRNTHDTLLALTQKLAQDPELLFRAPVDPAFSSLKQEQLIQAQALIAKALSNSIKPLLCKPLKRLLGHTGYVNAVTYSPDGKFIATGSEDKTVIIWNARTFEKVRTLTGHTGPITCLRYKSNIDYQMKYKLGDPITPDSCAYHLVNESENREIKLFGPAEHAERFNIAKNPYHALITGSQDATVRVWDAHSGELIKELKHHLAPITSIDLREDYYVHIKTTHSLKNNDLPDLIFDHFGPMLQMLLPQMIKDGTTTTVRESLILIGSEDGRITLSDYQDDAALTLYDTNLFPSVLGHNSSVSSVRFAPKDASSRVECAVAYHNTDRTSASYTILQAPGNTLTSHYQSPTFPGINMIEYSHHKEHPDQEYLVLCSPNKTAKVIPSNPVYKPRTIEGHQDNVTCIACGPDDYILTGSADHTARMVKYRYLADDKIKPICTLVGHTDYVKSVAFSPRGTFIITGSDDKTCNVYVNPAFFIDWMTTHATLEQLALIHMIAQAHEKSTDLHTCFPTVNPDKQRAIIASIRHTNIQEAIRLLLSPNQEQPAVIIQQVNPADTDADWVIFDAQQP